MTNENKKYDAVTTALSTMVTASHDIFTFIDGMRDGVGSDHLIDKLWVIATGEDELPVRPRHDLYRDIKEALEKNVESQSVEKIQSLEARIRFLEDKLNAFYAITTDSIESETLTLQQKIQDIQQLLYIGRGCCRLAASVNPKRKEVEPPAPSTHEEPPLSALIKDIIKDTIVSSSSPHSYIDILNKVRDQVPEHTPASDLQVLVADALLGFRTSPPPWLATKRDAAGNWGYRNGIYRNDI